MKDGPGAGLSRRKPEAPTVSVDDRVTDGQSHAHSLWLCGKERLEQAFTDFLGDARSAVLDLDDNVIIAARS